MDTFAFAVWSTHSRCALELSQEQRRERDYPTRDETTGRGPVHAGAALVMRPRDAPCDTYPLTIDRD